MLFNSIEFIILLLVTLFLYYLPVFRRLQVALLIAASFIFYGFYQPGLLVLLVTCILANSLMSYHIHQSIDRARRKLLLIVSVVFNLFLLCFFKYGAVLAGFYLNVSNNHNSIFLDYLLLLPLPIGISFYTFEGISLLVDVYRKKETLSQRDSSNLSKYILNTSFFISFFPHLISGPILKAHSFFPQIQTKKWSNIEWEAVLHYLVLGFFFKMVVADNLEDLTNILLFPYFNAYSTYSLLLAVFGFSIQMFADFAGYSLIAVGLGLLLGYNLPQNFCYPYLATSFSDFWHRWHISLSSWLKEYVYIPLGGNRKGEYRTFLNVFIVMLVGGIWHGSSWTYAIWGGMHGLFIIIEKKYSSPAQNIVRKILGWLMVFIVVSILWVLFKLPNIHHFVLFFTALFKNIDKPIIKLGNQFEILIYSFPIVLYYLRHILFQHSFTKLYMHKFTSLRPLVYGTMIFLMIVNSGNAGKFIYFQF